MEWENLEDLIGVVKASLVIGLPKNKKKTKAYITHVLYITLDTWTMRMVYILQYLFKESSG